MTPVGPAECTRLAMALRVPLYTVVTVGLGILAHLAGGGRAPGPLTLVTLVTLVTLLWKAMARIEQSLLRLLGGVLWVQAGMHLLLAQGHPQTPGGLGSCADMAGAAQLPAVPGAVDPAVGHALHASGWMWLAPGLAHTLAALAVACWLRRAEAACWRALRRVVSRLLPTVRRPPVPAHTTRTWVDAAGEARPAPPPLLLGHRWRGPPLALARPRSC